MKHLIKGLGYSNVSIINFRLNRFFLQYKKMLRVYKKESFRFFLIGFSILTLASIVVIEERKKQLSKALEFRASTIEERFLNSADNYYKTISIADLNPKQSVTELAKICDALIWINSDLQINKVIYRSSDEINFKNSFNENKAERGLLENLSIQKTFTTKNLRVFPHNTSLSFVRTFDNNKLEKEFFICSIKLKEIVDGLELSRLDTKIVIEDENHQELFSSFRRKRARGSFIPKTISLNNNEYLSLKVFPTKQLVQDYLFLNLRFLLSISGLLSLISSVIFFKLKANHLKQKLINKIIYFFNEKEQEEINLKLQEEINNLQKLKSRTTGFCKA